MALHTSAHTDSQRWREQALFRLTPRPARLRAAMPEAMAGGNALGEFGK